MTETKVIMEPSLHKFCFDLQEAVQEGFTIDPNLTPTMFGTYYECGLIRDSGPIEGSAKEAPTEPTIDFTKVVDSSLAALAPNLSEALSGASGNAPTTKPRGRPAKGGK